MCFQLQLDTLNIRKDPSYGNFITTIVVFSSIKNKIYIRIKH